MRCGISTACFFPQDTLQSLQQVIAIGSPVTEIFLNTFSEIETPYVDELYRCVHDAKIEVVAFHPFSSMLDGFFFASTYERRFFDGEALYRRYFEICKRFGAKKLVFHGDHEQNFFPFPKEKYAQHFRKLSALARSYDVTLCHENVFYCRLGASEAVREIKPMLQEAAAFTLDIKQAYRKGEKIEEMLAAMGKEVRHIHISDHNQEKDCILPGQGDFDFKGMIQQLQAMHYEGDLIIELYQDGFDSASDLAKARCYIDDVIRECEEEAIR